MADNIITPINSGVLFAADDVGSVLYPRTKVSFGVDGAATDVSANAPLPTVDTPVATTLTAILAKIVTNAATDASVLKGTSADDVQSITPSDSVALSTIPKALYIAVSGTLTIKGSSGTAVSFGTVSAGQVIPVRARYVMQTGTSATVVALI